MILEFLYCGGIGFILGCGLSAVMHCIFKDEECKICDAMARERDAAQRQQDALTKKN